MKSEVFVRQGDVLFHKISNPKGAMQVDSKGHEFVVAEGEKTGHMHRLTTMGDIKVSGVFGEQLMVILDTNGTVTHEEHGPVTLEAGVWEVTQERELDHAKDASARASID